MKAIKPIAPSEIEVLDVPKPEVPGDGILIKVHAVGICGSDLRRYREGPVSDQKDRIPGHEVAGEVVDAGGSIDQYEVGDRVAITPDVRCEECWYCRRGMQNLCEDLNLVGINFIQGGMAEYMALPGEVIEHGVVNFIPEGLSYEQATLGEPLCSVLAAQDRMEIGLGSSVGIFGGGPIGNIHVEVARARGAETFLFEIDEARRQTAKERTGPDFVKDPSVEGFEDFIYKHTEGRGLDVAIVAAPSGKAAEEAVRIVRKRGKVVLFAGFPDENPDFQLDNNEVHYDEKEVYGSFSYHPGRHKEALNALVKCKVDGNKIITHTYPLEKAQEAYEQADQGGSALKVVLRP